MAAVRTRLDTAGPPDSRAAAINFCTMRWCAMASGPFLHSLPVTLSIEPRALLRIGMSYVEQVHRRRLATDPNKQSQRPHWPHAEKDAPVSGSDIGCAIAFRDHLPAHLSMPKWRM